MQFDPGRGPWNNVLIEHCTLWTGPLAEDAADFRRGERPGENAVDTKQRASNPRSQMTIRSCLMYGWNQPAQLSNASALNLKNHVAVEVEQCLFHNNEICFRVRGGLGEYGGSNVKIRDCRIYDSGLAVRAEDGVENLKISKLGIGQGVKRPFHHVGGLGPGFENVGQYTPPPLPEFTTDRD